MSRKKQSDEAQEKERLPGRLRKVKRRKETWQTFESEARDFKLRLVRIEEQSD
jgi:hypothetical protein